MIKRLNEEGLGYSMISIAIGFVMATMVLIFFSPVMNFFAGFANGLIGDQSVYMSAQGQGTLGIILGLFAMSPIIIIVGFLIGSFVEANYKKQQYGGGLI